MMNNIDEIKKIISENIGETVAVIDTSNELATDVGQINSINSALFTIKTKSGITSYAYTQIYTNTIIVTLSALKECYRDQVLKTTVANNDKITKLANNKMQESLLFTFYDQIGLMDKFFKANSRSSVNANYSNRH